MFYSRPKATVHKASNTGSVSKASSTIIAKKGPLPPPCPKCQAAQSQPVVCPPLPPKPFILVPTLSQPTHTIPPLTTASLVPPPASQPARLPSAAPPPPTQPPVILNLSTLAQRARASSGRIAPGSCDSQQSRPIAPLPARAGGISPRTISTSTAALDETTDALVVGIQNQRNSLVAQVVVLQE